MITPPSVAKGDKIAIISPATEVKAHWVEGAVEQLRRFGYDPIVMPHALGSESGTYAATDAERRNDLRDALTDPEIRAILCARGGYGCNHLLSKEMEEAVRVHPKWLIGFSDVSALHALWQKAGVKSLHASMAKQLALYDIESQSESIREAAASETPKDEEERKAIRYCTEVMMGIISGEMEELEVEFPGTEGNISGEAKGRIVGGNLAVLNGLAGTPWDILTAEYLRGKILFLEDVGEKIYQIERMLKRLQLGGVFEAVSGVIFGQFTEYKGDRNFGLMEEMIRYRMEEWGVRCPVAMNVPIGHQSFNLPIVESAKCEMHNLKLKVKS